ncbi:hypothetical protein UFOVP965_26 [uncultured Caudovirales phage]|uniref:Uncharacterized protein n=1 Tax=uncultured Caudovirales phage TaxID=2100421 RepID=A0A6J5QE30_9CAUD|nr:hypothetical protein UFOVP965_26 [uncultured Caudovirales phage]CAB4179731.1 hypothetical protein UFOVP1035_22 [uncultured Caudovirales phage]CAB4188847.1 hypothetical protein UFOVP1181_128 [uncultured Caudovirales phage]
MSLNLKNKGNVIDGISPSFTEKLTRELHNAAKRAGWPEHIVRALAVEIEDSSLVITRPTAMVEEIEDLEHGKGSERPNAVLLPFINKYADEASKVIEDAIINGIMEQGGVW